MDAGKQGLESRTRVRRNFILQQGMASCPTARECLDQFSALMFQPRLVGAIVLVAVLLQSAALFLLLGAVLWWNVAVPRHNPFDALYNATFARGDPTRRLAPALPPRRFAQGMAGSFMIAAGLLMGFGHHGASLAVQVVLLIALLLLVLGRFCLGSFVYHLLRGRGRFAMRTSPWSRPPWPGEADEGGGAAPSAG